MCNKGGVRALGGSALWGEDHTASHNVPILIPKPHTLHRKPYTLHPKPYTLHPTPYTLHPTP